MGKLTLQLKRGSRKSPLFNNLNFFEKRKVLKKGLLDWSKKGTKIFKQGEKGRDLFVLLSGEVAIVDENGPTPHRIALLKDGDVFGELGFVSSLRGHKAGESSGGERLASAYANEEAKLFRFNEDAFKSLMEESPRCAGKLLLNLFSIAVLRLRGSIIGKRFKKPSDLGPKIGQGLTKEQMQQILSFGQVGSFSQGQTIMIQDKPGKDLYVVMKGLVDIYQQQGKEKIYLVRCEPGDLFGELAMATGLPRLATAEAHEECKVFSIDRKGLHTLLKRNPSLFNIVILNLLEAVRCRLRAVI